MHGVKFHGCQQKRWNSIVHIATESLWIRYSVDLHWLPSGLEDTTTKVFDKFQGFQSRTYGSCSLHSYWLEQLAGLHRHCHIPQTVQWQCLCRRYLGGQCLHVTSHTDFPPFHGIRVTPSGHLPSSLVIPVGFTHGGVLADVMALCMYGTILTNIIIK